MNAPRTVLCRKLREELPALPFKPFPNEFGQALYDSVSLKAWQMWLRESPRFINTYGWDLQSEAGKAGLLRQMKIYFGFEEGDLLATAWRPPTEQKGDE
jgi:Fe-S cluster biosynthesis and repair protein YggX